MVLNTVPTSTLLQVGLIHKTFVQFCSLEEEFVLVSLPSWFRSSDSCEAVWVIPEVCSVA